MAVVMNYYDPLVPFFAIDELVGIVSAIVELFLPADTEFASRSCCELCTCHRRFPRFHHKSSAMGWGHHNEDRCSAALPSQRVQKRCFTGFPEI